MTNKEFAESLRELADFYDTNEELTQVGLHYVWASDKEDLAKWARAFGSCEKEISVDYYSLKKKFGNLELHIITPKKGVCRSKVVGKKWVEETVVEGIPSRVTPAHEEDVVEWECDEPLLAPKDEVPE